MSHVLKIIVLHYCVLFLDVFRLCLSIWTMGDMPSVRWVTLPPFSLHLEDFSMRAADWGTNIQLEDQWEFQNPKMRYPLSIWCIKFHGDSSGQRNRRNRPSLIQSQIVRGAAGSSTIEKLPNSLKGQFRFTRDSGYIYRPVTLVSAGDTTGAKRAKSMSLCCGISQHFQFDAFVRRYIRKTTEEIRAFRQVPVPDFTSQFVQEFHCWISLWASTIPEGQVRRPIQQVHFHVLVCERPCLISGLTMVYGRYNYS